MKEQPKNILKDNVIFVLVLIWITSCNSEKYQLRWKVNENKPLYYQIETTLEKKDKPNIKINDKPIDSIANFLKVLESLSGLNNLEEYIILEKDKNTGIDFKVALYNQNVKKKPEEMDLADAMSFMVQALSLQANIDNSGKLVNNNLNLRQKNLVHLYCQLPQEAVGIGDSWELDVELVDNLSSYPESDVENRNKVKLADVKIREGRTIAIIEYNIFQSVETITINPFTGKDGEEYYSYSFRGNAEFDIDRGRWIKFDATSTTEQSGFVESKQKKQFKLLYIKELPKELSKRLNQQSEKMQDYLDLIENTESNNNKPEDIAKLVEYTDEVKNNDEAGEVSENEPAGETRVLADCPETYAVQVLASKKSIPLNDIRFKAVKNDIYEIIKPNEVYKYKYCVGKECLKNEAQLLKEKLIQKGFQGVFVVKVLP